jgi:excisionase family DNA binding protein
MTEDVTAQKGASAPKTVSVPEAGIQLGVSRNAAYQAAKEGEIPTIPIGRLRRVPQAWLDRVLSAA